MDEKTCQALAALAERLTRSYPQARIEVKDYKWSTEDVSVEVLVPRGMTEEEENQLMDTVSGLTGDLWRDTGVYILALERRQETTEA